MAFNKFEYSPFAVGIYKALLWSTTIVGYHSHNALIYYIPFLLFLGLGLRPVLEKTGLHTLYLNILWRLEERRDRKRIQQIKKDIAMKNRNDKYRNKRTVDPALPKNW